MVVHDGPSGGLAKEIPVRPKPERFRVSVPAADEAVLAWIGMQDNHSQSIRMLIRESIERHGYIDVVNRPVAQLPKRGRPSTQGDDTAPSPIGDVTATSTASTELDLSEQERTEPELLGIALVAPALAVTPAAVQAAPAAAAAEVTAVTPEPISAAPMEVNDIFSALRS